MGMKGDKSDMVSQDHNIMQHELQLQYTTSTKRMQQRLLVLMVSLLGFKDLS